MATLRDIMTREPFTTTSDATVADVARSMVKGRFGSALVCDGSWLTGIVTERDVLRAAAAGVDVASTPVSAWMTADPVTVTPDSEVDDAAQLMLQHGFRHLPVLDGRKIVGVVSLRDVLSTRIARRPS